MQKVLQKKERESRLSFRISDHPILSSRQRERKRRRYNNHLQRSDRDYGGARSERQINIVKTSVRAIQFQANLRNWEFWARAPSKMDRLIVRDYFWIIRKVPEKQIRVRKSRQIRSDQVEHTGGTRIKDALSFDEFYAWRWICEVLLAMDTDLALAVEIMDCTVYLLI